MQNSLSQQSSQQQSLQQTIQLNANQLQGLTMLAAPLQELDSILAVELANNPLLEALTPPREELAGDPLSEITAAGNEISRDEFDGEREDYPMQDALSDLQQASNDDYSSSYEDAAEAQKRRDFMFDSLVSARTLVDILLEQLNFYDLEPKMRYAAEQVIGSLDERGFLTTPAADIAMSSDLTLNEVENAIALVQSFDPPGVAARDAAECLILQLKRRNCTDERIYKLLTVCRDDLENNRLPKIAQTLGISLDEIYSLLDMLKNLNSVPAAGLESARPNTAVIPELSIEIDNGTLTVSGRDNYLPRLGIVQKYLKMLDNPDTPDDTRQYLREKLSAAENLIKSLELRQDTLTRITNVIAEKQADFFRYGIAHLQPMTMAEVAQTLDLHETTVSRAVANKYLNTPQGIKEYRFFFSGGYKSASGEDVSSRGVKELIRQMIDEENPRKPLSDAAISQQLADQGLDVARRTVAKYRESMNIPPTNLRRRH